jgi:precorrin-6A/cobalt-precorrin-6A reductase
MPPLAAPAATVLILGGTTEARSLADTLAEAAPELRVISSLAGRTTRPLLPRGEIRVGGFGGVDGLAAYLRDHRIGAVVDATHPFAAGISANAGAAAARAAVPLFVLRRPGWVEQDGDVWHRVPTMDRAAALVPRLGRRVFLTTGRQSLAAFAGRDECWFLARSVEPPGRPAPRQLEVVLDRGPFTVDGERRLLRAHRIDVLVSKDSGGPAAKLDAARELGVPVILVDRPAAGPVAGAAAGTVADAVVWVRRTMAGRR